jgi:hypothetical protein
VLSDATFKQTKRKDMIKQALTIVILLHILNIAVAQETKFVAPDYKAIKKIISDKKSSSFYPLLMERFTNSDTSLTLEEFRNLYYGFLFSEKYTPYPISKYIDSCNTFLGKDTLTKEDYQLLIKFEKLLLNDCPFNIRNFNILGYSYSQIGDSVSAEQNIYKMNMIIDVIMSTGDGKTEKSAFHVIAVSHEYDILKVLGFKFAGKQMLTKGGCDFLEIKDNQYNIDGLYFNVTQLLKKENEMFNK